MTAQQPATIWLASYQYCESFAFALLSAAHCPYSSGKFHSAAAAACDPLAQAGPARSPPRGAL